MARLLGATSAMVDNYATGAPEDVQKRGRDPAGGLDARSTAWTPERRRPGPEWGAVNARSVAGAEGAIYMNWQFWKSEKRDTDFTGAVIEAALSAARGHGGNASAAKVAATVFGVGLLSRGFATAKVNPPMDFLDASALARIARSLLLTGNSLHSIDVDLQDGLALIPAVWWDIGGGIRETSWRYRLDMAAPGGRTTTRTVAGDGVIHCRMNESLVEPWRGVSPLTEAGLSAALLANLETRMSEEAKGRVGYLLPIPEGISDEGQTQLRADLGSLAGGVKVVETTSAGAGSGRSNAPLNDWKPQRLGADFPVANVELRKEVGGDVLAALGVPSALMSGEGAASREAWRHVLVTTLTPMGRLVETELSRKLEMPIEITFPSLATVDIAARARAYASLTGAGMDAAKAERLAGLMS